MSGSQPKVEALDNQDNTEVVEVSEIKTETMSESEIEDTETVVAYD